MLTFDKNFATALRNDPAIMNVTNGRIFNPGRPEIDEEEDMIPYIIIANEGGQNLVESKDCDTEGSIDSVSVSVLVVAEDREALADLSTNVRNAIRSSSVNWDRLSDYNLVTGPVQFDQTKPCQYVVLTYQCEIYNE